MLNLCTVIDYKQIYFWHLALTAQSKPEPINVFTVFD